MQCATETVYLLVNVDVTVNQIVHQGIKNCKMTNLTLLSLYFNCKLWEQQSVFPAGRANVEVDEPRNSLGWHIISRFADEQIITEVAAARAVGLIDLIHSTEEL